MSPVCDHCQKLDISCHWPEPKPDLAEPARRKRPTPKPEEDAEVEDENEDENVIQKSPAKRRKSSPPPPPPPAPPETRAKTSKKTTRTARGKSTKKNVPVATTESPVQRPTPTSRGIRTLNRPSATPGSRRSTRLKSGKLTTTYSASEDNADEDDGQGSELPQASASSVLSHLSPNREAGNERTLAPLREIPSDVEDASVLNTRTLAQPPKVQSQTLLSSRVAAVAAPITTDNDAIVTQLKGREPARNPRTNRSPSQTHQSPAPVKLAPQPIDLPERDGVVVKPPQQISAPNEDSSDDDKTTTPSGVHRDRHSSAPPASKQSFPPLWLDKLNSRDLYENPNQILPVGHAPGLDATMQKIKDRFFDIDVTHLEYPASVSDAEAELEINPHYRLLLGSDLLETRSLPSNGEYYGPRYNIAGADRDYNPYMRNPRYNYEEQADEEGIPFGVMDNVSTELLSYSSTRKHAVYRRVGMKHQDEHLYHNNHIANASRRTAWHQQYVDKNTVNLDFIKFVAEKPANEFLADFEPYLMKHHALIPLFERHNEAQFRSLEPLTDYSPLYACLLDVKNDGPVTLAMAARAMRTMMCLAIGSLERFPHDYDRARQYFMASRTSRDILFLCNPLMHAQTLVLTVQYFILVMQFDQAWVTLSTAIGICLKEQWHLNTSTRHQRRVEREERRRVWWACVLLERHLLMYCGLQPMTTQRMSFKADAHLPSRQTFNILDDIRPLPWDLMTAYPEPSIVDKEDLALMKVARATYDFTDSAYFKLYLEQSSFIERIIDMERELRFDGTIGTALEKLAAYDMDKPKRLVRDMGEWESKVPPHYNYTLKRPSMPNEACKTQSLTLTWWTQYLHLRFSRPFFAIVLADAIHDKRPSNPDRPKPPVRLDRRTSTRLRTYVKLCMNSANILLHLASELLGSTHDEEIKHVLPRNLVLQVAYEAAKIFILASCLDKYPKLEPAPKEGRVDDAIMLLTEFYAAPPVGQACSADLIQMREEVEKMINDDGPELFEFPDPSLLESLPYDLRETELLP